MQNPVVVVVEEGADDCPVALLRVGLLGGFRVERAGVALPDCAWQHRRSAKRLIKLLATHPGHSMHREQVLEILWRDAGGESARNSFGKALHAARRALEPELPPRERSAYLRLSDDMLTLDTDHVRVDADHFQQMAESALQLGVVSGYEAALAAYTGELLPEDRYDDWSAARRNHLAELHIRLLVRLAEEHEKRGASIQAADRLRAALQQDPTREEVHRRLMRLYAEIGSRIDAVRQYQICQEVLQRELDITPDRETRELYEDILANRIQRRMPETPLDYREHAVGNHGLPARWIAEAYGELVDRLDTFGRTIESAIARQKLAMALIAMEKYDRALGVLKQAEETYTEITDEDGVRRVAAQIDLVRLLQREHQSDVVQQAPVS